MVSKKNKGIDEIYTNDTPMLETIFCDKRKDIDDCSSIQ